MPSSLAIIIRKHVANQEWEVVHRPSSLKAPLARTTGLANQERTDLRKCEIFSNPTGEGGSRVDLIHETVIEFSSVALWLTMADQVAVPAPAVEPAGPLQRGRGVKGQYVYWMTMPNPLPLCAGK